MRACPAQINARLPGTICICSDVGVGTLRAKRPDSMKQETKPVSANRELAVVHGR